MRVCCCLDLTKWYDPISFRDKKGLEGFCKMPGHLLGLLANRIKGCWLARCSAEDISKMPLTPELVRCLSSDQLTFLSDNPSKMTSELLSACLQKSVSLTPVFTHLRYKSFTEIIRGNPSETDLRIEYNSLHTGIVNNQAQAAIGNLNILDMLHLRDNDFQGSASREHFCHFIAPETCLYLLERILTSNEPRKYSQLTEQFWSKFSRENTDENLSQRIVEVFAKKGLYRNKEITPDRLKHMISLVSIEKWRTFMDHHHSSDFTLMVLDYFLTKNPKALEPYAYLLLELSALHSDLLKQIPTSILLKVLEAAFYAKSFNKDLIQKISKELSNRKEISTDELCRILTLFQKAKLYINLSKEEFDRLAAHIPTERLFDLLSVEPGTVLSGRIQVFFEEHDKEIDQLLDTRLGQLDTSDVVSFKEKYCVGQAIDDKYLPDNNLAMKFHDRVRQHVKTRLKAILLDPNSNVESWVTSIKNATHHPNWESHPLDVFTLCSKEEIATLSNHSLIYIVSLYRQEGIDKYKATYLLPFFQVLLARVKQNDSIHKSVRVLLDTRQIVYCTILFIYKDSANKAKWVPEGACSYDSANKKFVTPPDVEAILAIIGELEQLVKLNV